MKCENKRLPSDDLVNWTKIYRWRADSGFCSPFAECCCMNTTVTAPTTSSYNQFNNNTTTTTTTKHHHLPASEMTVVSEVLRLAAPALPVMKHYEEQVPEKKNNGPGCLPVCVYVCVCVCMCVCVCAVCWHFPPPKKKKKKLPIVRQKSTRPCIFLTTSTSLVSVKMILSCRPFFLRVIAHLNGVRESAKRIARLLDISCTTYSESTEKLSVGDREEKKKKRKNKNSPLAAL